MKAPPDLQRRSILHLGMGLAVSAGVFGSACRSASAQHSPAPLTSKTLGMASANPSLTNAAVMVAGPVNAVTSRWAALLAPLLGQELHPGISMTVSSVGGRDGVTGANAFEALTNPDGSCALLVPGAAAVAWLAGDPRVHFDAGRWVPALTSFGSAVLLGRTGTQPARLRVAASTANGVELPALLGLSLLGRAPIPVFGLSDPRDAYAALLRGQVDAILLTGSSVPQRAAAMASPALRPVFSLGNDADGTLRDPALPDVPTIPELYASAFGRKPAGDLFDAWKATAAAARLDVALVLQPLTPASLVAQWRHACIAAIADPVVAGAARTAQLNPLPAPDCVSALATVMADENTLLTLRRWIASHADWRPA